MPEVTLTVQHQMGLHARPARLLVETAGRFESDITISRDQQTANARSILRILALGVCKGMAVTIHAEGVDAPEALRALASLIGSNFGEEG